MNTTTSLILSFTLFWMPLAQAALIPTQPLPTGLALSNPAKDPILGKWLYHGKYVATFWPDGTTSYPNGLKGTWRFLNNREGERRYEIVWKEGVYVEKFKLSTDGNTLEGTNKKGEPIRAERIIEHRNPQKL